MVELRAQSAPIGDALRPRHRHRVAGAAEVRGDLLHPLERRVERPRPADVEVVLALCRPEVVEVFEEPLGIFVHAVLERGCAPCAVHRSFRGRAVVAGDVDDERVVGDAEVVERTDHAIDLVIGVGEEAGEGLHQSRRHRSIALGVVAPRGDLFGSRRERGVGRNDAECELAGIDLLAQGIPASVESSRELVDPLARHVMRCMHGGRGEVTQHRSVWRAHALALHPLDGLVGEILGQVVVGIADVRRDRRRLVVDGWLPLRGFCADDAVEAIEAESRRPAIERTGRTLFPGWREVPLAEACGRITVHAQHLGNGGRLGWNRAVVSREGVRDLGDAAHVHRVVIASGEERRARR